MIIDCVELFLLFRLLYFVLIELRTHTRVAPLRAHTPSSLNISFIC